MDDDDDCQITYVKEGSGVFQPIKREDVAPLRNYRKRSEYASRDTSPTYSRREGYNNHCGLISEEELLRNDVADKSPVRELEVSLENIRKFPDKKWDDIKPCKKGIRKNKESKIFFKDISRLLAKERRFKRLSESTQINVSAELSVARSEMRRKLTALAEKKKIHSILDILLKLVGSNEEELSSADKSALFLEDTFGRKPDILSFSISSFSLDEGLKLKYIKDIGSSVALNSLGCAYDPIMGFIFSGGTKIFCCSETGQNLNELAVDLINPSAVCPIVFGEALAFLTDDGVHLLDLRNGSSTLIWRTSRCRGLGVTNEGNLVVSRMNNGHANLILYNPIREKVVFSLPLPRGSLPSFLQVRDNFVFVSDLGLKMLHICKATERVLIFEDSHDLSAFSQFPSGIAVDEHHEMLIAGADERSLWRLNASLRKSSKTKADNFPYAAGIAVSCNGYVLASCRRSHGTRLFKAELDSGDQVFEDFGHITIN